MGFGVMCVCGRSRVPFPASGMMTFMQPSWCARSLASVTVLDAHDVGERPAVEVGMPGNKGGRQVDGYCVLRPAPCGPSRLPVYLSTRLPVKPGMDPALPGDQ